MVQRDAIDRRGSRSARPGRRAVARVAPGVEPEPGRGAHGGGGVRVGEPHAAGGEPVQVRGPDGRCAVAGEVTPAEVVAEDDQEVRLAARPGDLTRSEGLLVAGGGGPGRPAGGRGADSDRPEEVPAAHAARCRRRHRLVLQRSPHLASGWVMQPSRRPAVPSLEHAAAAGRVPTNGTRLAAVGERVSQDSEPARDARITATSRQRSPTAVAAPKADDAANAR